MIDALAGAALYRWRGMSHPDKRAFGRPYNQIVFAFPYALAVTLFWWNELDAWALLAGLVVLIVTTLGVLTGHGRGMDLGDTDAGEPERLEFLIKWLKPHVPLYFYDMALLSITGLAITLPAGIAIGSPLLALSGLLKGPAYAVAKFGGTGTAGGELLTGALLWGAIW